MDPTADTFLQRVAIHGLPAALSRCHEFTRRRLVEITRLAAAKNGKKLRQARWNLIRSDIVKIGSLHRAGFRSECAADYVRAAQELDLKAPNSTPISYRAVRKRRGGWRFVVSLPVPLKAKHKLLASLIEAQFEPPSFIYSVRGRGRDDLIATLAKLWNEGFTEVICCDIADCFTNVDTDALTTLPLPRGVIEQALFPANLRFVRRETWDDPHGVPEGISYDTSIGIPIMDIGDVAGPRGLMQGSPASNIAMTYLLRRLVWPNDRDARVVAYCDDFFIVGRSMEACQVVRDALAAFFTRCSFGPLTLLTKDSSASGYFEALGYGLTRTSHGWWVEPSSANYDRLDEQHAQAIEEDLKAGYLLPHTGDAFLNERLACFTAVSDRDRVKELYRDRGMHDLAQNEAVIRKMLAPVASERGLDAAAVELAVDAIRILETGLLPTEKLRRVGWKPQKKHT